MRTILLFLISILVWPYAVWGGQSDTNLLSQLNIKWAERDSSNLLSFVEVKLRENPTDPALLFARGVVAAVVEKWGLAGAEFLRKSVQASLKSKEFSDAKKIELKKRIETLAKIFEGIAKDAGESSSSGPKWDEAFQEDMYKEFGDEFPFMSVLSLFFDSTASVEQYENETDEGKQ